MTKPYTVLSCFSGIAGLCALGIKSANLGDRFQVTQFIEKSIYCQRVLRQHFPQVPIHDDICTFNSVPGFFDVVVGGFPCTDISIAGKQAGIKKGTRSGLFYEMMRIVRQVQPQFVLLENVPALLSGRNWRERYVSQCMCGWIRREEEFEVEQEKTKVARKAKRKLFCPACGRRLGDGTIRPVSWMGTVLRELSQGGFDAEWSTILCADLGVGTEYISHQDLITKWNWKEWELEGEPDPKPFAVSIGAGGVHKRERVFIIAISASNSYCQRTGMEESSVCGQGWKFTTTLQPTMVRQDNREIVTEGIDSSLGLPANPNDNGCNSRTNNWGERHFYNNQEWNIATTPSNREQLQSEFGEIRSDVAYPQSPGQNSSRREELQNWSNSTLISSSDELANRNSTRLETWQRQSDRKEEIPELERSDDSNDSKLQTFTSICGKNDGISRRMDQSRRADFNLMDFELMQYKDLPDWLPRATDTEYIFHRSERLQALGNAVVPQVAAIVWSRIAYIADLLQAKH